MKVQVSPFRVSPQESVIQDGWLVDSPDGPVQLQPMLATWDFQTDLRLSSKVSVDRAAALQAANLAPASELELLVMVRSSNTKIERNIQKVAVAQVDEFVAHLEFVLQGHDLGGRISLETLLVAKNPIPGDVLAASSPGSILWRATQTTVVEGTEGQFPTDAEDFAVTLPQSSEAGWVLRVDQEDMHALFTSAVRLTMNSGLPAIQRLLQGNVDPSTLLLARMLDLDVTRQLVHFALRSEEIRGHEVDHEALTLAGVLRSLLAQIWPSVSPETLHRWAADSPDRIEVQLQSVRRLAK